MADCCFHFHQIKRKASLGAYSLVKHLLSSLLQWYLRLAWITSHLSAQKNRLLQFIFHQKHPRILFLWHLYFFLYPLHNLLYRNRTFSSFHSSWFNRFQCLSYSDCCYYSSYFSSITKYHYNLNNFSISMLHSAILWYVSKPHH